VLSARLNFLSELSASSEFTRSFCAPLGHDERSGPSCTFLGYGYGDTSVGLR
jgi:hypothetical protein